MKINLLKLMGLLFVAAIYQGCGNEVNNTTASNPGTMETGQSTVVQKMKIQAFNDVNNLVTTLSQNGIGTLKPWQNPMDLGYGSLTDYYPIGTAKEEYGLTNNLAYYLEGTETTAKNLLINLNINNPGEKQLGLATLSKLASRTFKSLDLNVPEGLLNAIKSGKEFKSIEPDFTVDFTLDQSKIETWKVLIVSK